MNYFKIFAAMTFLLAFGDSCFSQSVVWSLESGNVNTLNPNNLFKRHLVADKYDTLYTVTSSIGTASGNDITMHKYDNNGTHIWERTYDSGNYDFPTGSLILDYQNNIYVMGMINIPGDYDAVLLKYDRNGNLIWTRVQDSTGTSYAPYGMEQDQYGNLVVLCRRIIYSPSGTFRSDYYILKYDLNGTLLWKSSFNFTSHDYPRELCIAGENICITGKANSPGVLSCVTVLNSSGMILWQNTSSSSDLTTPMPVTTDGTNFYVSSDISAGYDHYIQLKKFGSWGSVLWTYISDSVSTPRCLAYDYLNNRIIIAGIESNSVSGNQIPYIAAIKATTGVKVWEQRHTTHTNGNVKDLKVRSINGSFNIYLLGNVTISGGNTDFALWKYSSSGSLIWNTFYEGTHHSGDQTNTLAFGGLYDFYISGDCGFPYPSTVRNYALLRVSSTSMSPISGTNKDDNTVSEPEKYSLEQNFPNPFNPSTTIKFSLPVEDDVVVSVSDITGKEISQLLNQKMNAGYHEIEFDGSNLASGIYFYRITTPRFTDVKKMVLVK